MSNRKPYREDLTGLKFYNLTVVGYSHNRDGQSYWLFRCDCGVEKVLRANIVKNGNTKSCGCFQIEYMTSHGQSEHPMYQVWNAMIQRCYNAKQRSYEHYGGRGITVCERWLGNEGLANFIEDMYSSYQDGLSIERKSVNEGYSLENCEWATSSQQGFNRRKAKNNTTGKTGVGFKKNKKTRAWTAYIYKDRKRFNLGNFDTFEEAKSRREEAELELFGFIKD